MRGTYTLLRDDPTTTARWRFWEVILLILMTQAHLGVNGMDLNRLTQSRKAMSLEGKEGAFLLRERRPGRELTLWAVGPSALTPGPASHTVLWQFPFPSSKHHWCDHELSPKKSTANLTFVAVSWHYFLAYVDISLSMIFLYHSLKNNDSHYPFLKSFKTHWVVTLSQVL